ncbi:MAG TPA: GNAT family N-acetyltransferase [Noviherbaspirillum sp.]|nr:GNAT family N-acetyltransferase [Noviherbaspirillum sp.]
MEIALSELDRLRFSIITAKAKLDEGDAVDEVILRAKAMQTELLIVRLPTTAILAAQDLEKNGATLTDTLVYFQKKKIEKYDVSLPEGYAACIADSADAEMVEHLAADAFKGYFGHYHADRRLGRTECDAVYSSWAKNSCSKGDFADEVILVKKNGEIAAFATLKKLEGKDFEGVLFGVAPNHQGKGLYLNLMQLAQNWGCDNGSRRLLTSTQITNVTVQKNWCRVGMEPLSSFYTFHLWLGK